MKILKRVAIVILAVAIFALGLLPLPLWDFDDDD